MKTLTKHNGKNPEFRFICLSGYNEKDKYRTITLLHKPFDWDKLIALAERHRMISHVYCNIMSIKEFIPIQPFKKIQQKCENNRLKVIRLAGTLIEATTAFNENNIPVVVLKGPLMAVQFYEDIGMKQSRDIDLLVERENIDRCDQVLKDIGCKRIQPDFSLTGKQKKVHENIMHHHTYLNPKTNTLIELHWRLLSPPSLMPIDTNTLMKRSVKIKWEEREFNVLADADRILYLAAHGAKHQWYRLYWLKDFSAALNIFPDDKYEELMKQAGAKGLIEPLMQGILLSNILFDYELPDEFIPLINKKHYRLAKAALAGIKKSESKNLSRKAHRILKILYTMQLRKGIKYKWDCIWTSRTVEKDWKTVKLPDRLFVLYYFLRPFLWFYDTYIAATKKRQ